MLEEVIQALDPLPGQTIVDGTLGGGGHTRALSDRVGKGGLILALDRDPTARRRPNAIWPAGASSWWPRISASFPRCYRSWKSPP